MSNEPMPADEIRSQLHTNLHRLGRFNTSASFERVTAQTAAFATTVLALAAVRDLDN